MNLEDIKKLHQKTLDEKAKKEAGGEDFLKNYIKLESPGTTVIRILPWKDGEQFFAESSVHKYQDEEGKWHNYYCRRSKNEDCPFCTLVQDLWATHKTLKLPYGTKSKYGDMASKLKAKARYFINVVDRRVTGKDENPVKILSMSKDLFDVVVAAIVNPEFQVEGEEDKTTILSLDRGNDFKVIITKKGDYNNFDTSIPYFKKCPVGTKQQISQWMDSLHDIFAMGKIGDYEEGKKTTMNLRASLETVSKPPEAVEGADTGEETAGKFNQTLKA